MPKKVSRSKRWRVPVRVDVTYLGHVIVEGPDVEAAMDKVWEMEPGLKDIKGCVYHTEEKMYLEGQAVLDDMCTAYRKGRGDAEASVPREGA